MSVLIWITIRIQEFLTEFLSFQRSSAISALAEVVLIIFLSY